MTFIIEDYNKNEVDLKIEYTHKNEEELNENDRVACGSVRTA